jgi:hypothetical protein
MKIATFQGFVENGQVRLLDNVRLPEKATVFVVVPGAEQAGTIWARSPRLAHPEQAGDFKKEIIKEDCDAVVASTTSDCRGERK